MSETQRGKRRFVIVARRRTVRVEHQIDAVCLMHAFAIARMLSPAAESWACIGGGRL